jgi:hypothetical protein
MYSLSLSTVEASRTRAEPLRPGFIRLFSSIRFFQSDVDPRRQLTALQALVTTL